MFWYFLGGSLGLFFFFWWLGVLLHVFSTTHDAQTLIVIYLTFVSCQFALLLRIKK